jgi:hypothetical protein
MGNETIPIKITSCPYCEKYGVIDCVRRSRPGMEKYSKKRLLEVIDDLLNHHHKKEGLFF